MGPFPALEIGIGTPKIYSGIDRMAGSQSEENDYRIWGLSDLPCGILFLVLASAMILAVAYQLYVGRVYTKSGDLPLDSGLAWPFLAIEVVASGVGLVRGTRMLQRWVSSSST